MRRAAKRDDTERLIVDALIEAGCKVFRISQAGMPDLFVQTPTGGYWLEVKSTGGKLTGAQKRMRERGLDFRVVRTIKEAFDAVGIFIA